MKTTQYLLITGAFLLMGHLLIMIQPSVASIDEEYVNIYDRPSGYEQNLQDQEKSEMFEENGSDEEEQLFEDEQELLPQQEGLIYDENSQVEDNQPGDYEQEQELEGESFPPEDNIYNQDEQAMGNEQPIMQEGEEPFPTEYPVQ